VRWIQAPTADADRPAAVLELSPRKSAGGGSSPLPWIGLAVAVLLGMGGTMLFLRR